jgi:hypothetical protein
MKPAMEKQVTLLAWNLEADVAEACSRNDGLLAFVADDRCPEFHKSLPALAAAPCKTTRHILLGSRGPSPHTSPQRSTHGIVTPV